MQLRREGFTLVEAALCCVAIALISAGFLFGDQIIHTARLKSQLSQISRFNTGVEVFQQKYGYFPGDIPLEASKKFSLPDNGFGGNGDGIIKDVKGHYPIEYNNNEPVNFFVQLSSARLIEGNFYTCDGCYKIGEQFPNLKLAKAGITVTSMPDKQLWYYLGINPPTGKNNPEKIADISHAGIMTAQDAFSFDSKLDDGKPLSGKVRPGKSDNAVSFDESGACVKGPENFYNLSSTNPDCRLLIAVQ